MFIVLSKRVAKITRPKYVIQSEGALKVQVSAVFLMYNRGGKSMSLEMDHHGKKLHFNIFKRGEIQRQAVCVIHEKCF